MRLAGLGALRRSRKCQKRGAERRDKSRRAHLPVSLRETELRSPSGRCDLPMATAKNQKRRSRAGATWQSTICM